MDTYPIFVRKGGANRAVYALNTQNKMIVYYDGRPGFRDPDKI